MTETARARCVSTVREYSQRATDLVGFVDPEFADAFGEEGSPYRLEVVERRDAVDRETVIGSERDLGGDVTDRPRHRRDDDPREHGNRLAARDDEDRTALVGGLGPPDLTLARHRRHHGSSAIIRAEASSAQPTSVSVCGVARYPAAICSPRMRRR